MDALSCVLLASLTVLVYDTLDTLPDQINYVWTPPYSYGSLLYLVLRYFPFIDGIMAVNLVFTLPTPTRCRTENRIVTCIIVIGILLSEGVLALRTYALYNRSRWITYVLAGIWVCTVIPALAITGVELASLEYGPAPPSLLPIYGCHFSHASPIIIGAYLLLVVSETAVLVLTIVMAIRHLRRASRAAQGWVFQLYRDGVVFYVSVILISLLNVLLPIIDRDYANWLASPQHTIHAICSCRVLMLILKQRRGNRGGGARGGKGHRDTTSSAPTTGLNTDSAILSTMPTAWISTEDPGEGEGMGVRERVSTRVHDARQGVDGPVHSSRDLETARRNAPLLDEDFELEIR